MTRTHADKTSPWATGTTPQAAPNQAWPAEEQLPGRAHLGEENRQALERRGMDAADAAIHRALHGGQR